MSFRLATENSIKLITLHPRSLLVLSGASRFVWEHGISRRKSDFDCRQLNRDTPRSRRLSVTYRSIRKAGECLCGDAYKCDSMKINKNANFKANFADNLTANLTADLTSHKSPLHTPLVEKTHVHQIYNMIAPHFSKTREIKWPQVKKFLSLIPPGSIVADIGCGNGKYFGALPEKCFLVGVDNCLGLLEIAREAKNGEVVAGDALAVPIKSEWVDYVISVALLHHISTIKRRKQCAAEILRIVKPGGTIFVCAWALEQDKNSRFKFDEQDCLVDWNLQKKYFDEKMEKTLIECGCEVDDLNKTIIVKRFCHVFKDGELDELFNEFKDVCEVEESFYNNGNWCVVVRKK